MHYENFLVFTSLADMQTARDFKDGQMALLRYNTAEGDGYRQFYYWDADATDTDASSYNLSVIQVNDADGNSISTGRWKIMQNYAGKKLVTEAGAGITGGTGTVYESAVVREGGFVITKIMIDLTGLNSMNTDDDIIGVNDTSSPCHLGQITAAQNGTILFGTMTCLEVPAGGDPNINLYSATEATGVENGAIGSLTETQLIDAAGDWTLALTKALGAVPAANEYLYLTQGDATGTDGTYTAGKFLIELTGYDA